MSGEKTKRKFHYVRIKPCLPFHKHSMFTTMVGSRKCANCGKYNGELRERVWK